MYIINTEKFLEAMKGKGFATIGALAKVLRIHRNTIHYYLSGHGVFPEKLNQIFSTLDLKPEEVLTSNELPRYKKLEPIVGLVDSLEKKFPQVTFVLFGSRAKQTAQKYADWDIGVFSAEGITHVFYRQIRKQLGDLAEHSPFNIDLVNLNNADSDFLKAIAGHWIFLGGKLKDWLALQQKAESWKN